MIAIGAGGEPGTYTSTPSTASTPPAVSSSAAHRPPEQASVPTATSALGSGMTCQVRSSGARIAAVTGPVTSSTSAWRGAAVRKNPRR